MNVKIEREFIINKVKPSIQSLSNATSKFTNGSINKEDYAQEIIDAREKLGAAFNFILERIKKDEC